MASNYNKPGYHPGLEEYDRQLAGRSEAEFAAESSKLEGLCSTTLPPTWSCQPKPMPSRRASSKTPRRFETIVRLLPKLTIEDMHKLQKLFAVEIASRTRGGDP